MVNSSQASAAQTPSSATYISFSARSIPASPPATPPRNVYSSVIVVALEPLRVEVVALNITLVRIHLLVVLSCLALAILGPSCTRYPLLDAEALPGTLPLWLLETVEPQARSVGESIGAPDDTLDFGDRDVDEGRASKAVK